MRIHISYPKLLVLAGFFLGFFNLFFLTKTFGSTSQNNLITVSPSIIRLDLANDLPEAVLTYTNNTNSIVSIFLSSALVNSLQEGYKIQLSNPENSLRPAEWISFSHNTLNLLPHSSQSVFVLINKNKLTIGGNYATVLAKVGEQKAGQGVYVQGVLSSLVFVRTDTGKEISDARLLEFTLDNNWQKSPLKAKFSIFNNGNVDITPYGIVQITDFWQRPIARGIINIDSLITLPQSARQYTTNIILPQTMIWPGIYNASLSIHYGKQMHNLTDRLTLFTLGNNPNLFFVMIAVGVGILLIILALVMISKRWRKQATGS